MPLNYSKWDALELSDDSDIEGHPNVDHKSLVRMKQRQIHEQRAMRKQRVAQCEAEVACNGVLLPRLKDIHAKLLAPASDKPPVVYYNQLCDQLRTNPSPDKPDTTSPDQPTYDQMVLSLLLQISEKVKDTEGEEERAKKLAEELNGHIDDLVKRTKELEEEIETEKQEQKKRITSDDVRDGFETHYQPPAPAPAPLPKTRPAKKSTTTTTEFEVLNPGTVDKGKAAQAAEDEEEDEGIPELTPNLLEFSRLPLFAYDKSFEFIQRHRDVVVGGASDALLVAGFRAQRDSKSKYAKQCVHQSLLLQYGEKLGVDGFGMFFKKMIAGDPRAKSVFEQDVEKTYAHLVERVRISEEEAAEEQSGRETIQLVPQSEDQTITFNVPDGPPPENLTLEGPGTEDLDVEEVREMLQFRWEAFQAFPTDFQEALKTNKLEEVNKVLGEMEVSDAEKIVQALQAAGIMSFAGDGIVDQTGK